MGWQYYGIKYSPLLPAAAAAAAAASAAAADDDDDDEKYWIFTCWLGIEWEKSKTKKNSFCTSVG